MKELEGLAKLAESLLENDTLEQAQKWYRKTLDRPWEYVVFVVRRCYILALILEEITGKRMEEESEASFLTDAAFFLRCEEIAQKFRQTKRFPKILLCDDVLVHGRNLNHLLSSIQKRLFELLPECDEKEIESAFADAVHIQVIQRSNQKLLLAGRYASRLRYEEVASPVRMHKTSSDISTLLSVSGMANACYVFSEHFSDGEFSKINAEEFTFSSFQNIQEYSQVLPVGENGRIKAVFTLRIFSDRAHEGYRAIPFVFLPNLGKDETAGICREVLERLGEDHSCGKWLCELEKIEGKRSFNELLSLIFSNAALQEFNARYDIQPDQQDRLKEIRKLSRNYDQHGLQWTEQSLQYILDRKMFGVEELGRILSEHMSEERYIVQLKSGNSEKLSTERIRQIVRREESFFYDKGHSDEKEAYELSRYLYVQNVWRIDRFVRGACFDLRQLFDGYSHQEFVCGIAYFLQMMDAGILSLSSYASRKIRVVGYAQFSKAGEQSLFLLPSVYYKYISMLTAIQHRGRQLKGGMAGEISRFRESEYCSIGEKQWEEIAEFLETLAEIGQTPEDWDEDFLKKKDFSLEEGDSEISKLVAYVNEQIEYKKKYVEYTDSKEGYSAYIKNLDY